jgi:uncharacterized membrane protein
MSASDVEWQEPKEAMEKYTMIDDDNNDGKGMGIAIFVLIIYGIVSSFLAFEIPHLSLVCFIAATLLASILTCGCCCAKKYKLKPHVKKMATATLVSLILMEIVSNISSVIMTNIMKNTITMMFDENATAGTFSDSKVPFYVAIILAIIGYILTGLALIFSGIFIWGRKCCAPRLMTSMGTRYT